MLIKTEVDNKNQLTIIEVTGTPSFEDSMAAFKRFYEGNITQKVMFDFRKANLSAISSNDIETILDYIQQHVQKRVNGKSAVVISRDLEYGMLRMIQALTKIKAIPLEIKIFKSIETAFQWLEEKD